MINPEMTNDTTKEAEEVLLSLVRSKPPSQRLSEAITASNRVVIQCKNAIRRMKPELSENEVTIRFVEINYGRSLAEQVAEYLTERS